MPNEATRPLFDEATIHIGDLHQHLAGLQWGDLSETGTPSLWSLVGRSGTASMSTTWRAKRRSPAGYLPNFEAPSIATGRRVTSEVGNAMATGGTGTE